MHTIASEALATVTKHPIITVNIIAMILAFLNARIRKYTVIALSKLPLIVVKPTYMSQSLGEMTLAYLNGHRKYKGKTIGGELYGNSTIFDNNEKREINVAFKWTNMSFRVFYTTYGWSFPIVISGQPLVDKAEGKQDIVKNYGCVMYTFRWSKVTEKIILEAMNYANDITKDKKDKKFYLKRVCGTGTGKPDFKLIEKAPKEGSTSYVDVVKSKIIGGAMEPLGSWGLEMANPPVLSNSLENMSLNKELECVVEEVKFWLDRQEWYEERGIPWKRGYLFYGMPGTGKTLFSRALAEHLDLPLVIFDLASMNSQEFVNAWSQLLMRKIVLFEDFDAVFNKRENVADSGLDFGTFLNALDGADKKQGLLTIITTNHPEKLDFALGGPVSGKVVKENGAFLVVDDDNNIVSTHDNEEEARSVLLFNGEGKMPPRPGRIDRTVQFVPLDFEGRMKLAMRIVKDKKEAIKLVNEGVKDSAAQLQERCFRKALEMLYKK